MVLLTEIFSHWRIILSSGPGLAILIALHEAIRIHRPDIVDRDNRVRGIEIHELFDTYDFIVVGGGSAGALVFLIFHHIFVVLARFVRKNTHEK